MPYAKTRLRDLVRADQQARRSLASLDPEVFLPADLSCKPVPVGAAAAGATGGRGCLVFSRGRLVAVLVRLRSTRTHAPSTPVAGWSLEAGFGQCAGAAAPLFFGTLGEALAWVRRRLAQGTVGTVERPQMVLGHAR